MKLHLPKALCAAVLAAASTAYAALYEVPQFGGTEWTYNTETSQFDATGQESTATPGRLNNMGPVLIFNNVGTVTASTGGNTSDSGGVKVTGSSVVTTSLGNWAGSIYVGAGAVLTANCGYQIKATEPAGAATIYVDGTLNLNDGYGLLMNDGSAGQRWHIGEKGTINLGTISNVALGSNTWDVEIIMSADDITAAAAAKGDEEVEGIVNRTRSQQVTASDTARSLISTVIGDTIIDAINSTTFYDSTGTQLSGYSLAVNSSGNIVAAGTALRYDAMSLSTATDVAWTVNGTADGTLFSDSNGTATSFMNGDSVTISGGTSTLATDVTVNAMNVSGGATVTGESHSITATTIRTDGTATISGTDLTLTTKYLNIYGDTTLSATTTATETHVGGGKTLTIGSGSTLTTGQLRMSEQNTSAVTIDGGIVNVTGTNNGQSTSASLLLAHWGYASTLTLKNDGQLNAANTIMRVNWDGNGTFNQEGGTSTLLGINFAGQSGSSGGKVKLSGGTMNIGADGIINFAAEGGLELAGGTLKSTSAFGISAASDSSGSVVVSADTTINTDGGLINWNAPLSGSGNITKTGSNALNMKGDSTATGTINVEGGQLNISGSTFGIGAIHTRAAELSIGGSTVLTTGRLELGDGNGGSSTLSVAAGGKVIVTGGDTNNYKTTGLLLSEWNNTTTATINGALFAESAALSSGDYAANVTVNDGGILVVKGVRGLKSKDATINVASGGTLIINGGTVTSAAKITRADGAIYGYSADTTLAYDMELSEDTELTNTKYTVDSSAGTVTATSDSVNLTLSGTITGNSHTLSAAGNGVVKISGTISNASLGSDVQFVGATIGDGAMTLDGVTGYLAMGTNTFGANITLGENGFTSNNGGNGDTRTFSGTVSGSGNFTRSGAGTTQNFIFTGDVKDWTGAFKATNTNNQVTNVSFGGSATTVNAAITKEGTANTLNLTAGADSDQTFTKAITVDTMTVSEGKNVTVTGTLTAGAVTVSDTATLKLAQETATLTSVTLGTNAVLTLIDETEHDDSALSVTNLNINGNATINSNLIVNGGTITFAKGTSVTLGCTLDLGENTKIVLDATDIATLDANGNIDLFTGVDTLGSYLKDGGTVWIYSADDTTLATSHALAFKSDGQGGYTVYATPEPATATLSLLALAGLCARRRRRA